MSTSKIISLINGYSKPIFLGNDVVNLIISYYILSHINMTAYLLSYDNLKMYHIATKELYNIQINTKLNSFQRDSRYICNNTSLPKSIMNEFIKIKSKSSSITLTQTDILSTDWSLIFQFGYRSNQCWLTAFHPNLLSLDQCVAYNFMLPSILNTSTTHNVYNRYSPSIIYSKLNKTLYSMQPWYASKNAYHINLNNDMDNTRWNKLQCDMKYSRYNTSLCMVDNDRFISILGGINHDGGFSNDAELYAINCNKSIKLKSMDGTYINTASSLYHDKYHRIIIGGRLHFSIGYGQYLNMEWYDINKDKWMIIGKQCESILHDIDGMFISTQNPNILFLAGYRIINDFRTSKIGLYQMDLRSDTVDCESLIDYNYLKDHKFTVWGKSSFCVIHL